MNMTKTAKLNLIGRSSLVAEKLEASQVEATLCDLCVGEPSWFSFRTQSQQNLGPLLEDVLVQWEDVRRVAINLMPNHPGWRELTIYFKGNILIE